MSSGVRQIRLDEIAVGERVGFYHPEHAAGLAESIKAIGLQSPVHVRRNGNRAERPWRLVAGLHRLRAFELLGWGSISAIQVAGESSDAAELLLLELSENLDHRQPRPIERAVFFVARGELEKAKQSGATADKPAAGNCASDGKSHENQSVDGSATIAGGAVPEASAVGWKERTASALRVKLRTFELYEQIHRHIVAPFPELAQALNSHSSAESLTALKKLAQYGAPSAKNSDVAEQVLASRRAVIELLLKPGNEAMTIEAAITELKSVGSKGAREPIEEEREITALLSEWRKMPIVQRERFMISAVQMASKRVLRAMAAAIGERELRDAELARRVGKAG